MVVAKNGFSLIEVLIVVVIIGIIVAIAIPSYTQYVIKAKRIDAQSELLTIASRIQRYKIINNSLSTATGVLELSDLGLKLQSGKYFIPDTGNPLYEVTLSDVTANGTWTLAAIPVANSSQNGNGIIGLNNSGQKCWTKGSTCKPTSITNWDGK